MSIVKQTFYALQCDKCNQILSNGIDEEYFVDNEIDILDMGFENNWNEHEGKHYCNKCEVNAD